MGDVVVVADLFSIQFAAVLLDSGRDTGGGYKLGARAIIVVATGLRVLSSRLLSAMAYFAENKAAASKAISGFGMCIDFRAIASIACVYANTVYYRRSGKGDCCLRCSVSFAISS
jgi:hypothetical protein